MATARKTTKEVTTTETVYTLELSAEEHEFLYDLLTDLDEDGVVLDIRDALGAAQEDAPLAVGDRVRVTELAHEYTGRVGTLERIDLADAMLPHMVRFDDGDHLWTKGVERA